jgi:uncharacterized protein (TIGR02453 family)
MSHFDPDSLRFFRDLARHNERAWFHANKARYEAKVRDPFLRLIGELAEPLARISPNFRADPRPIGGSLFRIQRDTRFANDKTPYKTWAGARFFHERGRQVEAPLFYLQIAPGDSFVAAGLWRPSSPTLRRLRDFLIDNPAAWKRAVHAPAFRRRFELGGESLTRPPRGFAAGARADRGPEAQGFRRAATARRCAGHRPEIARDGRRRVRADGSAGGLFVRGAGVGVLSRFERRSP